MSGLELAGRIMADPGKLSAELDAEAARMIPIIRTTIRHYRYPNPGDYRLWPGPNSNTFVAAIMQAAAIKAEYALSYADAFAVATALAHDAVLLTGDPELLNADPAWRIEDVRPSTP